jgi:hypothetical protein
MLVSRAGINAGFISKVLSERSFGADERLEAKYQVPLSGRIRRTSLTRHTEHRRVTDFSLRDSSTMRPPQQGQCSSGFISIFSGLFSPGVVKRNVTMFLNYVCITVLFSHGQIDIALANPLVFPVQRV